VEFLHVSDEIEHLMKHRPFHKINYYFRGKIQLLESVIKLFEASSLHPPSALNSFSRSCKVYHRAFVRYKIVLLIVSLKSMLYRVKGIDENYSNTLDGRGQNFTLVGGEVLVWHPCTTDRRA